MAIIECFTMWGFKCLDCLYVCKFVLSATWCVFFKMFQNFSGVMWWQLRAPKVLCVDLCCRIDKVCPTSEWWNQISPIWWAELFNIFKFCIDMRSYYVSCATSSIICLVVRVVSENIQHYMARIMLFCFELFIFWYSFYDISWY